MNYFELFGIPVSLTIDKSKLAKKYFELQKKYHPDFFTQNNEAEQDEALEKSSAINKALKVFQNKDSTIKYVLQLKGLLEEEEKYQLRPDFLMEVMELNEQLSAESTTAIEVFENEEIRNIFTALGVTIGTAEDSKALNLEKLRYHKVIIMCDADVDGSHISTLILTFFFRFMKELIEGGHIYIAAPPLYLVKKGNKKEYAWNDNQRDLANEKMGGNAGIQRYKGLGEMNAEQLWETTMDPSYRTLRQVTIDSLAEADRVFSMLMGDEVPPRREFIEKNAVYAKIDA